MEELKDVKTAVFILERLVKSAGPCTARDQAYVFLKAHPFQGSYEEQRQNHPDQQLPTSIFDPRANVNRKQADALIERVTKAAEGHEVFVLTGLELLQLASMLYEMNRHLPDFFEEPSEESSEGETDMGGTQESFEVEEPTETKAPAAPAAPEAPPSPPDVGEQKAGE